jgi:hypothetical protein
LIIAFFCFGVTVSIKSNDNSFAQENDVSNLVIPVSLYLLDDEKGRLSSPSNNKRLIIIFDRVNEIWSQAGIRFDIKYIGRIVVPTNIIREIVNGNYKPFLKGRDVEFQVPSASEINIIYAKEVGLLNGITLDNNVIIIKDSPGFLNERVTAHELGHALNLDHVHDDKSRLMYPGTQGTALTTEEIKAARNSGNR